MKRFLSFALIGLLIGLIACGSKRDNLPPPQQQRAPQALLDQSKNYCEWSGWKYRALGYVHSKCDGSGFTSLYSLMCPNIDLSVFEDAGKLYRSPTHDCYVPGRQINGSRSESSRDMYLMRLIAAFEQKDIGYLVRVVNYGDANNWLMCDGDGVEGLSRCFIHSSLRTMHYDALKVLSNIPVTLTTTSTNQTVQIDIPLAKGYQAHLEVIKIWLSGRIYGGVTDYQLSRLRRYSAKEDKNALFSAIYHYFSDGDFSEAVSLLKFFPKDELPHGSYYCTEYLWQRSQASSSWKPCFNNAINYYSGTDFNFVVYIMNNQNTLNPTKEDWWKYL